MRRAPADAPAFHRSDGADGSRAAGDAGRRGVHGTGAEFVGNHRDSSSCSPPRDTFRWRPEFPWGSGRRSAPCVTAVLAGLGKPPEARRVGVVHVLFNVLGALLWLPFIDQLGAMATSVSPVYPDLAGVTRLAAETPRQVANAITIFAAVNLCVMIWFTGPIAWLAKKLVRDRPVSEPEKGHAEIPGPGFLRDADPCHWSGSAGAGSPWNLCRAHAGGSAQGRGRGKQRGS